MIRSSKQVPVFEHPETSHLFLESPSGRYRYGSLYGFTEWLRNLPEVKNASFSKTTPLLIAAGASDEVVFLIAACYLLKIPFMTVQEELTGNDLHRLNDQVTPPLIYSKGNKAFSEAFNCPALDIPPQAIQQSASYNSTRFTLSNPNEPAGLFMTSGSTGIAKIVPVLRRQVLFASRASADNFKSGKNRFWLLCLPLNHVGGVSIILRSILYNSAIYRADSFDVENVSRLLSDDKRFEAASMVPTMLARLMEDSRFKPHAQFKAILLGGGPISADLTARTVARGIPIVTSYGMTETFGQISANPILPQHSIHPPGKSVGNLFKPNKIEVRDQHNKPLPAGKSGRIWLKGPQVFDGYLSGQLNRNVFDDQGWFDTGDFGQLNHRDQLMIEARRTDLIITGGENVNPAEVEQALMRWIDIEDCAVAGIPDERWGQKVVAFYTGTEITDPEKVKASLKRDLLGFQVPKEFIRIELIPRTSLGKVKRRELIRLYSI